VFFLSCTDRSINRSAAHACTQRLEKLGEGQLSGPEDVYVDAAAGGTLYTATRDGWLQRMQPNGSWERWQFVGGAGLLGIAPSADGSMLVCDAYKVCAGGCCLRRMTYSCSIRVNFPGIAES
jgi:hypothetical protein